MAYLNDLKWQKALSEYPTNQRKVLLCLSHEKYRWRTKERIVKVTGLDQDGVDRVLSELISKDMVRASFSKKKNLIFGLRERVN